MSASITVSRKQFVLQTVGGLEINKNYVYSLVMLMINIILTIEANLCVHNIITIPNSAYKNKLNRTC